MKFLKFQYFPIIISLILDINKNKKILEKNMRKFFIFQNYNYSTHLYNSLST